MINWWMLLTNAIWIFGAALALAGVSQGYYQSKNENKKLKIVLSKTVYAFLLNLAGVVFCLGMVLTTEVWWEIGLWGVMTGLFGWQIFQYKIEN